MSRLTVAQIASDFGVTESTVRNWIKRYPEYFRRDGRGRIDGKRALEWRDQHRKDHRDPRGRSAMP